MDDTQQRTERYTHGHHESVLRSHVWRTVDNSAAYVADAFTPGTSVLDVGCGPGTITLDIARRVAPARVVGVDASADVIAQAADAARTAGVTNVDFVVGDVYALDQTDESFDVVHCHQTLQHLADPVAALREMYRVVRPGGILAARDGDYGGMFWTPASPGLDAWMTTYQAVHRSNGGDPDAGRSIRAWALAAGLTDVSTSASMWAYGTDDERAWWGGMWADRVVQSAFGPQALALGIVDQSGLDEMSEAWRAWVATPTAWFGVPHGEIVARKPLR